MQIISEFIWKKNSRVVNEDSLCICHVMSNGYPLILAAVCDGVGGMPNGELASNYVINSLKNCFNGIALRSNKSLTAISHLFNRCLFSCHDEISSGATTVNLVVIQKNMGFVLSSGDSRLYIGRNRLRLLTKDHCDSMGRLTQVIGTGSYSKPFVRYFHVSAGTNMLLCSDGFYRKNHSNILQKHFFDECTSEKKWKDKLEEMYFYALNQGEKDNCSAIALSFSK